MWLSSKLLVWLAALFLPVAAPAFGQVTPQELDLLNAQGAKAYEASDRDTAMAAWSKGLELARAQGDEERLGMFLSNVAIVLDDQGRYQEALELYGQSVAIARKRGERKELADRLLNTGVTLRKIGDHVGALDAYAQALLLRQEDRDVRGEISVLKRMVRIHSEASRYEAEIEALGRILALLEVLGDTRGLMETKQALGRVWRKSGKPEGSLEPFEQALTLSRELKDRRMESALLTELGVVNKSLGRFERSLQYYAMALVIDRELEDKSGESSLLTNSGNVLFELGRYSEALEHYQRSFAIRQTIGIKDNIRNLGGMGNVHWSLGQYAKAQERQEQTLALARELKDRSGEGNALINLGNIANYRSDHDTALGFYTQALAVKRELGDKHGVATVFMNIGSVRRRMGDHAEAQRCFEQTLAISRALADRNGEAVSLLSIADLLHETGNYGMALENYAGALAILRETGGKSQEASSRMGLGNVYSALGQYEKQIEQIEIALTIFREIGDVRLEANCLTTLGWALIDLGKPDQAVQNIEQALTLSRHIGVPDEEARALSHMGRVHRSQGRYEPALHCHEQAYEIWLSAGSGHLASGERANIGWTRLRMGDALGAGEAFRSALVMLAGQGGPNSQGRCHNGLAQVEERLGNKGAAIFHGKQAVNAIQAMRRDILNLDQTLQSSFMGGKEVVYRRLADLLMAEGRLSEAEQVLRMLKQEEYFDYTRRDQGGEDPRQTQADYNSFEKAWVERHEQAAAALARLGAELGVLENNRARSPEENARLAELRDKLQAGQADVAALLADCAQAFAGLQREQAERIKAERVTDDARSELEGLPGKPVLVSYLVLKDGLRILVTGADRQVARTSAVSSAELNTKIGRFRQALLNPRQDPRPGGKELYDLLVAPIRDDLDAMGAGQLTFSLDGSLRYIPMAALHDGTRWLVERYPLSVFTPAGRGGLKQPLEAKWRAAGFGTSQAIGGFAALPAVAEELRGVVKASPQAREGVLPGKSRLDQAFTAQALTAALKRRYPVVHIASHFSFTPGGTERDSFLLLGDGGHLTLADLRQGDFDLTGVDLLTLSACETAVQAQNADGRELDGLGITAQRRGARGVLASLWPVADQSTARLMRDFYRLRQEQGLSKAEALRRAQLNLIGRSGAGATAQVPAPTTARTAGQARDGRGQAIQAKGQSPSRAGDAAPAGDFPGYSHPFYWAPFILMGNWR
ncbi:Regulatory protein AfsR [Fundidesulfovibrio magnetotacticus]|uniref:Regulatory protein AfsR n=1 Tax=Fundidesulfovibrio magnetotacticus TaxID=2730080 RepID=A0A6V8LKN9_9BACT|nr:tetratricopeptide repeat protein [Fundidesulfovibrio magnetotacticus]GFK92244.1 Regulatory protein AfsR [Fundidesulfovibrio magnetotacticus]